MTCPSGVDDHGTLQRRMVAEERIGVLNEHKSQPFYDTVIHYANAILSPLYTLTPQEMVSTLERCQYEGDYSVDYWVGIIRHVEYRC